MAAYTETELKLRFLDPGRWDQVFASAIITEQADPLSFRQETLEAQYFDTPSHSLQKARMAFRIRREGGVWLAVVKDGGKHGGGLHQRAEWTIPLAEPQANIEPFMDTPVGPVLAETVGEEDLSALFTTCFERQRIDLHTPDGSIIELAADRGEIITTGNIRSPILEIELELKSGNVGALLRLGADLAREFPLLPEWRSKYFRALQLAGLVAEDEAPMLAYPPIVGEDAAGAALTNIIIHRIQCSLAVQDKFLQLPADPETLHQVRVQLRYLRSLLSFSKPFIPEDIYAKFQAALKPWTRMTGPLRETDAALAVWQEVMASELVRFSVNPVLGDKLAARRMELGAHVHTELHNGQTTPPLLDMWAWLANSELLLRPAATTEDTEREVQLQPTLLDFARERLGKWLDHMVKSGKNTDMHDAKKVHILRVRGKKIRYVLEALAPVLPSKTAKILDGLKDIQDSFGYLHDMDVNYNVMQELLRAQSSRLLYRDTGILSGWQAYKARSVHRKIKKQWKRFLRLEQEWSSKKAKE